MGFFFLLVVLVTFQLKLGLTKPNEQDELVPSKPMNVTVLRVSSFEIDLAWYQPEQPNGEIEGYRIYFLQCNQTYYRNVRIAESYIEYNLTDLKPFTDYKIWTIAFTRAHDGATSDPVYQKTDISGPSPPKILNLTCQADDALFVHWQRPVEFNNSIDFYYVDYRSEFTYEYEELIMNLSTERPEEMILIPNVTIDTMYEIKVRGGSRSIFDPNKVILGEESEPKKVYVTKDCDKMQYFSVQKTTDLSAGVIAGVVCAAFTLILAVIAYILWSLLSRKCFHTTYYYLDDPPRLPPPALVEWDSGVNGMKAAIPIEFFAKTVAELHADGDIGFSKEYELIQAASTQVFTTEHSQHPENKQKNRYLNILAYDHSRVQLLPVPGQKKCVDYVNANYIDGFMQARAYIGTQGPLPVTFDCFWRMVWEQRVVIIVMITNLVERGRKKCDMYWPKEGCETYGVIQVKLVKEDVMATYTVRTLQIKHLRIKKKKNTVVERLVYQYHYTNWPDHGTPDHPLPVLSFVKKSSAANPPESGPIIVHCSAGVGRTGTYIVLDAMLKQIRAKGEVNIYGFLHHIRTQRNYLVQTEEQYIFIHDALLEAIEAGETNISAAYFSHYIQGLLTVEAEDEKEGCSRKVLEREFRLVTSFAARDFHVKSGRKECNLFKNRCLDILPVESSRVHLTPKAGVDGSDYINATWFQGFQKLKEFIITQHPLEATVYDFWQMVWDHNAQTIVMLSKIDEQFWPSEDCDVDSDNFKVKFVAKHDHVGYATQEFAVHSLQDDYELAVRIIHCENWIENSATLAAVFETITMVQEWHVEYQNGPMIVMDEIGGTEAATFCCLTTFMKQLDFENHVDVYMYAKLYHNRRPGVWKNEADYVYLYHAMEALIATRGNQIPPPPPAPDIYLTVNGHVNGFVNNGNGLVNSGNGMTRLSPEGMEPAAAIKDSMA